MENNQIIQEIRTKRAENNKQILKLKKEICELENLNPNYTNSINNLEPEENRSKYFAYSFVMGISFILTEFIGGLIGQMGNNILLGLLLVLPFSAIPAFGSIYGFIKAIKFNKFKNKKVEFDPQLQNKLNLKCEELEKLEQLDHELYTQLCTELSKISTGFIGRSSKYKEIVPNDTYVLDNNIIDL